MVSQERFDGLARGLATGRLTRWQVLKGLGAGVLLSSAGLLHPWSARFAEGQTRAGESAPVGSISNPRPDPVKVPTCKKFNDYIEHTGVTDEKGKNYPNWGGYTSYKCEWDEKTWHWKTFECKDKNNQVDKNHVCVGTTDSADKPAKVKVTFTALGSVTIVDWQPPEPQREQCEIEEIFYQDNQVAHEQHHVNDIEDIVAEANDSWRNEPRFTASVPRKAGKQSRQEAVDKAHAKLRREVTKAEKDYCDSIQREILRRADAYDANHKVPRMECAPCCSEGETVCDGFCVDLLTDAQNCGKCGSRCHPSGEDCVGGICKCKPGFTRDPPCECCPPDRPKCCRTSSGVYFCEASCAGYGMN